jgi:outer membrane protein assembly factor BamB
MRTGYQIFSMATFRPSSFLILAFMGLLTTAPAQAEDWFRWRGPDLNGISRETGWQVNWPTEGPKPLWKASVGTGFSSMSVSHGRVYTMGNQQEQDTVYCFDEKNGASIWKHSYPCVLDPNLYEGGPSSTPTVDGDRVYSLSRKGDLFCLEAPTGKVVWSKNVHAELDVKIPTWGFAGSPLVEGSLVILNVGDAGTAFDKKTGKLAWTSGKGVSGYSTPVVFNHGKDRCVALVAAQSAIALKVADGSKVWSYPWKTSYDVNAADPIISDGRMFVSSGYGHGGALVDISREPQVKIWENKSMRNHISNSVLWQGHLYGVDENELKCMVWDTGEVKWGEKKFGKGSLMMADGKIIGLSDKGELLVAAASPTEFKPLARAQVLGGKCWSVPVLSNGRIYCRNAKGDLVCLDVSGK